MLAPLILFFLITMITVTKNDNSHQFPNKPSHPEKIKVVSIPLWKHLTMKSCSVLASGCRCSQQNIIVTTAVLISLCSCLLFFFFPSSPVFLFLLLSAYLHVSPVSTFFFLIPGSTPRTAVAHLLVTKYQPRRSRSSRSVALARLVKLQMDPCCDLVK